MKPRTLPTIAALAAAGLIATAGPAAAHHPEISATVGCKNPSNLASVFLKAVPWSTQEPARQINKEIWFEQYDGSAWQQVSFPGSFNTGQGPIVREVIVEAGKTYRFRAINTAPWGPNGEYGSVGEWRDITVTVDSKPCPVETPATTVPAPTTTAPTPPATTVAPPATTTPPPVLTVEQPPTVVGTAAVLERTSAPSELAYTGAGRTLLVTEVLCGATVIPFGAWLVRKSNRAQQD